MDPNITPDCTSAYISRLQFGQRCEAVKLYCIDPNSLIDFPLVHYCWFNEASLVSMPLMVKVANQILFIIVTFSLIGFICEEHISSAIARLSKKLRIPEAIAGATLLALANGASDIMTVLIASKAHSHNMDLAIGSLFGANIFVGSVVLAAIINFSQLKTITDVAATKKAQLHSLRKRHLILHRSHPLVHHARQSGPDTDHHWRRLADLLRPLRALRHQFRFEPSQTPQHR
jgi:sodium/potassium/calcium exchanger 6